MLRIFFEILLPLVLPTALYVAWVSIVQSPSQAARLRWAALPWAWLAGAGALLLVLMLVVVITGFGTSQPGVYVPPHWQNGRIIPGHVEPKPGR
jgi:Family of unknown function (DUF6111)